jgi:hypothetical protein
MLRLALVLMVAAGCADGMTRGGAPDLGSPHDGSGMDAGVEVPVVVCDAPVASLSGLATYVKGSAVAQIPTASADAPYGTCGGYVIAVDSSAYSQPVKNGQMNDASGWVDVQIASAAMTSRGCAYTLRGVAFSSAVAQPPCVFSADYLLTVP